MHDGRTGTKGERKREKGEGRREKGELLSLVEAHGTKAGAERGTGAPASDGDGGSGGAKPPVLIGLRGGHAVLVADFAQPRRVDASLERVALVKAQRALHALRPVVEVRHPGLAAWQRFDDRRRCLREREPFAIRGHFRVAVIALWLERAPVLLDAIGLLGKPQNQVVVLSQREIAVPLHYRWRGESASQQHARMVHGYRKAD